jgi:hypothetical protein
MSPDELRAALARIGLEKQTGEGSAARFFGIGDRTMRRWLKDGAPEAVALVLSVMIARKIKPATMLRIREESGFAPARAIEEEESA